MAAGDNPMMGFEGLMYYGVAGAEGATLIPETRDVSYGLATGKGSTTSRNPDGSIPDTTQNVTERTWTCDFGVLNVPNNVVIAALIAAATTGTPIALRMKDHTTGKGFNGDVILEFKNGQPLAGEQSIDFSAAPTRQAGRRPKYHE